MSSILFFLKNYYNYFNHTKQNLSSLTKYHLKQIQTIGQQFIKILIKIGIIRSLSQIKQKQVYEVGQILQEKLIQKLQLVSKFQLYQIFGNYLFQNVGKLQDQKHIQIQLLNTFFKILSEKNLDEASHINQIAYSLQQKISCPQTCLIDQSSQSRQQIQSQINELKPLQKSKLEKQLKKEESSSFISMSSFLNQSFEKEQKQKDKCQNTQNQLQSWEDNQRNEAQNHQDMKSVASESIFQDSFTLLKDNSFIQLKQQKIPKQSLQIQKNQSLKSCAQLNNQPEINDLSEKHFIEVVEYLSKLSSPQSQLTYIWQHLKFQGFQAYYDPLPSDSHQWMCHAKIIFPSNLFSEDHIIKSRKSKNKRRAKNLACMDLLKTIYLKFPEVWLIYKHLRQQKQLMVPPSQQLKDNEEIQIIMNRKDYYVNTQKIEKLLNHNKDCIRKMMEGISAKAELNTLLQQLAGRVTSPKMEKKMIEGNNWSVPVKIEYKTYEAIQNNKAPQVYTKTVIFHNKKVAEEQAYMEAIIKMYQENPDLFQKIQSIKLAKNIKDSPKKLQLLRVAKQQQKEVSTN